MDDPLMILQIEAKMAAEKTVKILLRASILKDYQVIKTTAQANINTANGEREMALNAGKSRLGNGLKGQTGDAAREKADSIIKNDYYNEGANSIKAYF